MNCPFCGFTNQANASYCANCATALAGAQKSSSPVASGKPNTAGAKRGVLILAVVGAIIPGIIVFFLLSPGGPGNVEGSIYSSGQPHGSYVLTPSNCLSGEHESFFGVWLTSDLVKIDGRSGFQGGLKLVKTHLGDWEVYLESPNECQGLRCAIRPVGFSDCSRYEVHVENTNTTYNDIRVRRGYANLECRFDEGGTLSANLTFKGCR